MTPKPLLISALISLLITFSLFSLIRHPRLETKLNRFKQELQNAESTIVPKPTKIMASGLPNRYLIKTTFVPQAPEKNWDQPWQDTCEEAALLTAVYYHQKSEPDFTQIKQDLLSMVDFETNKGWGHDINLDQMAQITDQLYGIGSTIHSNPTLEDLKKYIAQDQPVVVPANGKTLFRENKNFRSGGPYYHNLTILGYDDDNQQFITHDVGTQHGAYFRYSYSLLIDSIHDLPISGLKQDINQGEKLVLILLK